MHGLAVVDTQLQSGCISESDEIVLEDIVRVSEVPSISSACTESELSQKLAELHGSMNKVHSLILVNRIASAMSSLHGKGRLNAGEWPNLVPCY